MTKAIKGTVPFLGPELIYNLDSDTHKEFKHNPYKADVFSLGLCLLYMITFKKFNSYERETYGIVYLNFEIIRICNKKLFEI